MEIHSRLFSLERTSREASSLESLLTLKSTDLGVKEADFPSRDASTS